jgi:glycosyl transferase family 25
MTVFQYPEILVISLADCASRRAICAAQLNALPGVRWRFIDAVDGRGLKDYPPCYDVKSASRIVGFPLTQREIACFMSHQETWRVCLQSGASVVVLEDDFKLEPTFLEALQLAMKTESMWDIFRLQGLLEVPHKSLLREGGLEVVSNHQDPLGAAAYLIKPSVARVLLDASRMIFEPLDHYLEHRRYHLQRMVSVWPYAVLTQDVPSTITDRPPERVIRGWRKHKRSFFRLLFRSRVWLARLRHTD